YRYPDYHNSANYRYPAGAGNYAANYRYPAGAGNYAADPYGRYDGYYGRTYNAAGAADTRSAAHNARIVAAVAHRMGFTQEQTLACIATMLIESRGDARRVGD